MHYTYIPNTHINYQIPKDEYTPHMTGTGNAMKQMGFTYELKICVSAHHERNHVWFEVDPLPTRPQLTLTALNVPQSVQIIRLMDTAVGPTFYFWYYSSSSVCLVKPPTKCQLSYYCLLMMDIPLCAIEALYIKIWSGEKFVPIYCTKLENKWEIFSHRCTPNRSLWLKMPTMWILHPLCQQWHQTVSFCVTSVLCRTWIWFDWRWFLFACLIHWIGGEFGIHHNF